MSTFKIVGRTNSWIAQRDVNFKGKTEITICGNLTLKEAQGKLLDFFNRDYDKSFQNWGLARSNEPNNTNTWPDGLRGYKYDGRNYRIEPENDSE